MAELELELESFELQDSEGSEAEKIIKSKLEKYYFAAATFPFDELPRIPWTEETAEAEEGKYLAVAYYSPTHTTPTTTTPTPPTT